MDKIEKTLNKIRKELAKLTAGIIRRLKQKIQDGTITPEEKLTLDMALSLHETKRKT